jgi:hypothetical protein
MRTQLLLEKARRAHESKIIAAKSDDVERSQDRTPTAKKEAGGGPPAKWRFNVSL